MRYLSPVSGSSTTMVLPAFSGRFARSIPAQECRAGGYAYQYALAPAYLLAGSECVLIGNRDYFVAYLCIQYVRHEARAYALYLVGACNAGGEHRGALWLYCDYFNTGIPGLQILANACYSAAGAYAGYEYVNLAVGIHRISRDLVVL